MLQFNSFEAVYSISMKCAKSCHILTPNRLHFSQTKLFICRKTLFLINMFYKTKGTTTAVLYPYLYKYSKDRERERERRREGNEIKYHCHYPFSITTASASEMARHLHGLTSTKNTISFCYWFFFFLERRISTKRRRETKSPEIFAVSIIYLFIIIINAKICFSTAFTMSADPVPSGIFFFFCYSCPHLKKFHFFHFSLLLSVCLLHPFTIFAKAYNIFSFSITSFGKHVVRLGMDYMISVKIAVVFGQHLLQGCVKGCIVSAYFVLLLKMITTNRNMMSIRPSNFDA